MTWLCGIGAASTLLLYDPSPMTVDKVLFAMMRRIVAVTFVLVIAVGCGVSTYNESDSGFPGSLFTFSRTVVLAPLVIPPDMHLGEDVLTVCDSIIESEFSAEGFQVVPSWEYSNAWERIAAVMGGLRDSATGEWDEAKYEVAREQLVRDLSDSHDIGMVVRPELWLVSAPFSGGTARWDGTSQGLVGFGTRVLDILSQIFNATSSSLPEGTVPAASLGVIFEDLDGEALYTAVGGIEVLEKVGGDWWDSETIPDEELLLDHDRISNAVRIVLDSFLRRG